MIAIIVATDKNGVIGSENKIPWRIKSDLKRLSALTRGHAVILGRKTYESMDWYYNRSGREMPGKLYCILSRDAKYKPSRPNATIVNSIDAALKLAKQQGEANDIFIIGGASVFNAMLPLTDRIYLTEIQTSVPGDTYFRPPSLKTWHEVHREHFEQSDQDEYESDFMVLERTKAK